MVIVKPKAMSCLIVEYFIIENCLPPGCFTFWFILNVYSKLDKSFKHDQYHKKI